jgi:hypothetical protein
MKLSSFALPGFSSSQGEMAKASLKKLPKLCGEMIKDAHCALPEGLNGYDESQENARAFNVAHGNQIRYTFLPFGGRVKRKVAVYTQDYVTATQLTIQNRVARASPYCGFINSDDRKQCKWK